MTNQYGRPIAGRLNGIYAEPGTILGPKEVTREYVVALDTDADGTIVGYAQAAELSAAARRDPQSIVEARSIMTKQELGIGR